MPNRVGELATPRLAESGSRRLSDSPSFSFKHSKADSPTCRVGESPTRRVGESLFDYQYLREFEAKSGTARNVVKGTYTEPISAKTPENPPRCLVPLNRHRSPRSGTVF
jgi:hypothetical protein